MELGNFSISLAVADLQASLTFYETLGFAPIAGEAEQGWIILASGEAKIGLFKGMFEENLVTFNPPDARAVQSTLVDAGYAIEKETEGDEGACHLMVRDPDGNSILIDQH